MTTTKPITTTSSINEARAEQLGPIASIDVGFDVRVHGMSVRLDLRPGVEYQIDCDPRRIGNRPLHKETITGDAEALCRELVRRGYAIIAAETPNGRDIRATADGFEVQPHNDNYWLKTKTLAEAFDAFEHPENYRSPTRA